MVSTGDTGIGSAEFIGDVRSVKKNIGFMMFRIRLLKMRKRNVSRPEFKAVIFLGL